MSAYMTEEEQIEAIKKWWKRFGNTIIVLVSLILLSIAAYRYWGWHRTNTNQMASNAYENMMLAFSNQEEEKVQSYANELIQKHSKTVYADAARMTLAKESISNDKMDEAQRLLHDVVENAKIPAIKQVAKIRLARILLSQQKYTQALNELENVTDSSYEPAINELKGDIYAATGKYSQAIASYRDAISGSQLQGIGNLFLEMKTNELVAATSHSQSKGKKAHETA